MAKNRSVPEEDGVKHSAARRARARGDQHAYSETFLEPNTTHTVVFIKKKVRSGTTEFGQNYRDASVEDVIQSIKLRNGQFPDDTQQIKVTVEIVND